MGGGCCWKRPEIATKKGRWYHNKRPEISQKCESETLAKKWVLLCGELTKRLNCSMSMRDLVFLSACINTKASLVGYNAQYISFFSGLYKKIQFALTNLVTFFSFSLTNLESCARNRGRGILCRCCHCLCRCCY